MAGTEQQQNTTTQEAMAARRPASLDGKTVRNLAITAAVLTLPEIIAACGQLTSQDNNNSNLTCKLTFDNTGAINGAVINGQTCSLDQMKNLPLSEFGTAFTALSMTGPEAEQLWLQTDRPDTSAFYLGTDGLKHDERVAFDLIQVVKQNTDFQNQVKKILNDPSEAQLKTQLTNGDITDAKSDGELTMPIAQQGAWAELHQTTTPDILSQLEKNDKVALLLSNPAKGTQQYQQRLTLIANYLTTDMQGLKAVYEHEKILGTTSTPHFGLNENYKADRLGTGIALIEVDGGLVVKTDGTTMEAVLLLTNTQDLNHPENVQVHLLFITPEYSKVQGAETIQNAGSLTGKSVAPDQFMKDEAGQLIGVGMVDTPQTDKYMTVKVDPKDAAAVAEFRQWLKKPTNPLPACVRSISGLTQDSLDSVTPVAYETLVSF